MFDGAAAAYIDARPGYPDRIYEILETRSGLGRSSRVLEIGAGSGQATGRLASLAGSVVAIEPGIALADHLRRANLEMSNLEVIVSTFEAVELAPGSFDLVVAATAFHWIEPSFGFRKVRSLLRDGGALALWWNVFGDPSEPDPFHDATEPVLRDLASGPGGDPYALDVEARRAELSDQGFEDIQHELVRWTLALDPSRTRRLYASYSNIARLPPERRDAILDEIERIARVSFGGRVVRRMVTPIYTAHA